MKVFQNVCASLSFAVCCVALFGAPALAQSTFQKSPNGLAVKVQKSPPGLAIRVQATPGQQAAATAQSRCVELIKSQAAFERNIADYAGKSRALEAKSKSLTQNASAGRGSEKCKIAQEQVNLYRDTASEHLDYLDNIAETIKKCPSTMTEKLASAQVAIKKSYEVLERFTIGTEGALAKSCS